MSDEIEPVNRYSQRAARLRFLAADCASPEIAKRLHGMALQYEHLAKRRKSAIDRAVAPMRAESPPELPGPHSVD